MPRWLWGAAALLLLPALPVLPQADEAPEPEWLLHALEEAAVIAEGDVLSFAHLRGDVRIEATNTTRLHVKALAQYRADDPRVPAIRLVTEKAATASPEPTHHRLSVDFAVLEVAENEAWAKRRIDVALLVPVGLELRIETGDGLIEVEKVAARANLISEHGEIAYDGTGDLVAHSERGSLRALLRQTGDAHTVTLSTLTGDIRCTLLEGANARVALTTRGPITTDYSLDIDREAGSPLKKARALIGKGGSSIKLESHSGGLSLRGLIAPEQAAAPANQP